MCFDLMLSCRFLFFLACKNVSVGLFQSLGKIHQLYIFHVWEFARRENNFTLTGVSIVYTS